MKGRAFKDAMYNGLAKMMKALANPNRLEIIEMLAQGEKTVERIVQATNLSFANASQHLQVLRNSNILKSRKDGHHVYYSLASDDFLSLHHQVIRFAINEIAELEKTMIRQREDNQSSNPVSLDELETMIREKNVLLLDVRPPDEYELGHITGAVSVPVNELLCCLKDFSPEKEVIAYCRGPFCVLADEAVRILNEKGYNVRRLDEGYPEWRISNQKKNHHYQ